MRKLNSKIILSSLLTAMAVVIGYLFAGVPNVEFYTATVFISGCIVGPVYGAAIGATSEFLFSVFNPLGMAMPNLLIAQIISMAVVGWCGGYYFKKNPQISFTIKKMLLLGAIGFLLTLFFDVMTTLSFTLFMVGANFQKMVVSFLYGMSFYLIHLTINTVTFIFIVPVILKRIQPFCLQNNKK